MFSFRLDLILRLSVCLMKFIIDVLGGSILWMLDRRQQMPEEDLVELKFRLYDGSDIGPIRYSSSSTVAMLKERIISEWPRGRSLPFLLPHSNQIDIIVFYFSDFR